MKHSFLFIVVFSLFTEALPLSAQSTRSQVTKDLREKLHAGQFDALERFAVSMTKKTDGMGGRYPDSFYFCEAFQKPLSTKTGDLAWTEHLGELEEWVQEYPKSVYARVALARSLGAYAWEARGKKGVDSVTQEGWKLFRERLAKADRVLVEAEKITTSEVLVYHAWTTVGLGLHWPTDKYEVNFQKGIRADPNFLPIYYAKLLYLLPRWHGKRGDVERYAEQVADKRGGEDGDMLYMFLARRLAEWDGKEDFFDYAEMSWPRMKRGFEARIKNPRFVNLELNYYCYFACLKEERSTAKRLFDEIGDQWRSEVWDSQGAFEHWRKWAGE